MEKGWRPCWCIVILGLAVILFAWWNVPWGRIALTVAGALVALRGIVNRCCCEKGDEGKKEGCC